MKQRNLTPDDTSQGRGGQKEPKRQAAREQASQEQAAPEEAMRTDAGGTSEAAQKPPLFSTWKGMYVFVLVLHAVVIALLYFFTLNYQ